MSGNTNFPTALDNDSSLVDVVENTTALSAPHHNNLKEAVKVIEAKLGIYNTSVATSIDYRLGHPSSGHSHNGASGQGRKIEASQLVGLSTYVIESAKSFVILQKQASMIATVNYFPPVVLGKTLQLESIQGALRKGPSGATTAFDVNFGPTSVYVASQGLRPIFPAGATAYRSSATPNYITYPSGAVITVDVDAVGSNDPGQEGTITLVFRN